MLAKMCQFGMILDKMRWTLKNCCLRPVRALAAVPIGDDVTSAVAACCLFCWFFGKIFIVFFLVVVKVLLAVAVAVTAAATATALMCILLPLLSIFSALTLLSIDCDLANFFFECCAMEAHYCGLYR